MENVLNKSDEAVAKVFMSLARLSLCMVANHSHSLPQNLALGICTNFKVRFNSVACSYMLDFWYQENWVCDWEDTYNKFHTVLAEHNITIQSSSSTLKMKSLVQEAQKNTFKLNWGGPIIQTVPNHAKIITCILPHTPSVSQHTGQQMEWQLQTHHHHHLQHI